MDLSQNRKLFEQRLPLLSKKIFFLTLKFGFSDELCKDLTQDILFKAFLKLESFKGRAKLDSWVYSIGINYCINYSRKKRVISVEYNDYSEDIAGCKNPEQDCLDREFNKRLLDCVQRLPERLKSVIILQSFELLKDDEVSQILNIPKGTVWSRMNRARKLLKRALEKSM